jgi:hypothetical protein
MRALDLGDGGTGTLGHRPDDIRAGRLVGRREHHQDGSDFQRGAWTRLAPIDKP